MKATILVAALLLVQSCTEAGPSAPGIGDTELDATRATASKSSVFPHVIPLPDGFHPEGIAVGHGATFYVGSLSGGAIYAGDLRTGAGRLLVDPSADRMAVGLAFDRRKGHLFVAGGFLADATVFDTDTGQLIASLALNAGPEPSLINDAVVTRNGVFFTDSLRPVLYRLPLEINGDLPAEPDIEEIPLTGDFQMAVGGALGVSANGIVATPDGSALIINNTDLGTVYVVDPESGVTNEIDLGAASVPFGDGLLLEDLDLYVTQNLLNQVTHVVLGDDLITGTVVGTLTDDALRIPSTIAGFGNALYAVNARFDEAPPTEPADPDLEFEIVRMEIR